LPAAKPGDTISLADGDYSGAFVATTHVTLDGVTVHDIGAEAVHFRKIGPGVAAEGIYIKGDNNRRTTGGRSPAAATPSAKHLRGDEQGGLGDQLDEPERLRLPEEAERDRRVEHLDRRQGGVEDPGDAGNLTVFTSAGRRERRPAGGRAAPADAAAGGRRP
jgi:hypothetical protein